METTHSAFIKMKKNVHNETQRESVIPEKDIEEAVKEVLNNPYLGCARAALKLINENRAMLSSTTYNDIKNYLKEETEQELMKRRIESELEKNHKSRTPAGHSFERMRPEEPHQIWAIDFTFLKIFGIKIPACVIYDLFSMSYVNVEISETPSADIAEKAVRKALRKSGTKPKEYLLSDNGGEFEAGKFMKFLKENEIKECRIPPGTPWNNGALESGNKDFKAVIYTTAGLVAAEHPVITKPGTPEKEIFEFTEKCCQVAVDKINGKLPRLRLGVTPDTVLKGKEVEKRKQNRKFIRKKKNKRKTRMEKIKKGEIKSVRKTVEEKTKFIFGKIKKQISTNSLYAVRELLQGRYDFINT
jgi:transposase InsO family protein